MTYPELKEQFEAKKRSGSYPPSVLAVIELQLAAMEAELRKRGELPVLKSKKTPAPEPKPTPTKTITPAPQGSVVSITSNCIVKRHTLNNTVDIEFKRYPGPDVYRALAENGFEKRKGKDRTFWATLTDAHYQFALKLCQGREEQGKQAKVEKAEHSVKADEAQNVNEEKVFAAVNRAMNGHKIGYDNLSDDLKSELEKTKLVKFDLPPLPTIPFDPSSTDPQFQKILDDIQRGHNVLLVGGAGTGKTTIAKMVAEVLGRPWIAINCSQWTSPTEVIGGQTIEGYQEGKLIRAWQKGAILILDEMPKLDPNTAGLFNDALAEAQKPDPKKSIIENSRGDKFPKNPLFGCIATGNIYPNQESAAYGANNKQDLSLLDRFAGTVYWIEKDPRKEQHIIQNMMIWSLFDHLRTEIEKLKYEAQVSLRIMQTGRNAYITEMDRLKKKGDIEANAGHTLKSVVDSMLSTFNEVQQGNLKQAIRYDGYISDYQYRKLDVNKPLFGQRAETSKSDEHTPETRKRPGGQIRM